MKRKGHCGDLSFYKRTCFLGRTAQKPNKNTTRGRGQVRRGSGMFAGRRRPLLSLTSAICGTDQGEQCAMVARAERMFTPPGLDYSFKLWSLAHVWTGGLHCKSQQLLQYLITKILLTFKNSIYYFITFFNVVKVKMCILWEGVFL